MGGTSTIEEMIKSIKEHRKIVVEEEEETKKNHLEIIPSIELSHWTRFHLIDIPILSLMKIVKLIKEYFPLNQIQEIKIVLDSNLQSNTTSTTTSTTTSSTNSSKDSSHQLSVQQLIEIKQAFPHCIRLSYNDIII
jgi:hypothetical protein